MSRQSYTLKTEKHYLHSGIFTYCVNYFNNLTITDNSRLNALAYYQFLKIVLGKSFIIQDFNLHKLVKALPTEHKIAYTTLQRYFDIMLDLGLVSVKGGNFHFVGVNKQYSKISDHNRKINNREVGKFIPLNLDSNKISFRYVRNMISALALSNNIYKQKQKKLDSKVDVELRQSTLSYVQRLQKRKEKGEITHEKYDSLYKTYIGSNKLIVNTREQKINFFNRNRDSKKFAINSIGQMDFKKTKSTQNNTRVYSNINISVLANNIGKSKATAYRLRKYAKESGIIEVQPMYIQDTTIGSLYEFNILKYEGKINPVSLYIDGIGAFIRINDQVILRDGKMENNLIGIFTQNQIDKLVNYNVENGYGFMKNLINYKNSEILKEKNSFYYYSTKDIMLKYGISRAKVKALFNSTHHYRKYIIKANREIDIPLYSKQIVDNLFNNIDSNKVASRKYIIA